ncbi:MAG: stage II sporulation protein M [Clostridiales bacterium]|nr:stage II sporulation protein M [Clostridiales bacterium]
MVNDDTRIRKILRRIGKIYKELGAYLKDNRWFILFMLILIIEIVVFYVLKAQPDDHYVEYVNETEGKYPNLFLFIFIENIKTNTKVMLCGIIPLFLGSMVAAMLSIKGLITSLKLFSGLLPLSTILICTVPHGLMEIPCIAACMVFGCLISKEITLTILKAVRKKELVFLDKTRKTIGLKKTVSFIFKSWLMIILPMTFTAAMIETYITPLVMKAAGLI